MRLRADDERPLVIGHRGASAVAAENSLDALAAAVEAGADYVEFDVAPGLVVAHDAGTPGPSLAEALELLAPTRVGLHVDVKAAGYEREVVELVRGAAVGAVLYSTAYARVARRLREVEPQTDVAIGYPRDSYGVSRFAWPDALTRTGAAALRAAVPLRIPPLLRAARANVLALHHTLCSPAAIRAAHRRGVPVLAWTANDPDAVRRLAAAGADGIVSDDPAMARRAVDAS